MKIVTAAGAATLIYPQNLVAEITDEEKSRAAIVEVETAAVG